MNTLEQVIKGLGCPVCGGADWPVPQVAVGEAGGRRWFTDGIAMFRGAWPGECELTTGTPPIAELLAGMEHVQAPVTVVSLRECAGQELLRLSSGADVSIEWWPELTEGRELTPHHEGGKTPIVFRDAAGAIAAVLMPVIASDSPEAAS